VITYAATVTVVDVVAEAPNWSTAVTTTVKFVACDTDAAKEPYTCPVEVPSRVCELAPAASEVV